MSYTVGKHFEQFILEQVKSGRYKNGNDVIRHGLSLVERQANFENRGKHPAKTRPQSGIESSYHRGSILKEEELKALLQREDGQRTD